MPRTEERIVVLHIGAKGENIRNTMKVVRDGETSLRGSLLRWEVKGEWLLTAGHSSYRPFVACLHEDN